MAPPAHLLTAPSSQKYAYLFGHALEALRQSAEHGDERAAGHLAAIVEDHLILIVQSEPGGDSAKLGETSQGPGLPGLLGPGRLRLRGQ